ncbi:hypothetical protein T10_7801 [Trichinella papuae]|uniref:Uncharacterized protein n=1 Tax=Trichinella papuae TaxID=268474 RepID=A0A0V1MEB6_9BILA|nr:hypothetical protein T10_7801 [Trichinella papuae]
MLPPAYQCVDGKNQKVLTRRIHGTTFAATNRCQMKRHAECWRATKKDDNLTALDQENMVGAVELSINLLNQNFCQVLSRRILGTTSAATHRCQMKHHAECWTASKTDDNLTALNQENMVSVVLLNKHTVPRRDRIVSTGFPRSVGAFAERFHSTTDTCVLQQTVIQLSNDCQLKLFNQNRLLIVRAFDDKKLKAVTFAVATGTGINLDSP